MRQLAALLLLIIALTAAPAWACEGPCCQGPCEEEATFTPVWGQAEIFTVDVGFFRCVRQTGGASFVRILWVADNGTQTILASAPINNTRYPFTMSCYAAGPIYSYLEINEVVKLDVWHLPD